MLSAVALKGLYKFKVFKLKETARGLWFGGGGVCGIATHTPHGGGGLTLKYASERHGI
jgi:hypothetical protein